VLCLAQLNRQVEQGKEGRRPQLSHLRESGAIEQDADVVMFVHREEYYCDSREQAVEKGVAGQADLLVRKQRNGPTGDIKLAWFAKHTRFENLSQKPYEEFAEYQEEF
jgi:replicative DNA helicase